MIITQEAVEAAYNAFQRPKRMLVNTSIGNLQGRLEAAFEAALPFLEEQIRAQIAAEVRLAGKRTSRCLTFEPDNCDGCAVRDEVAAFAAEIAEGLRS